MSFSSTNKTLVCINTCLDDTESLYQLKETDWYQFIEKSPEYRPMTVLADPKVGHSFTYEDKLIIKTEEEYTNLCMKTFYMIDYFMQNTTYDYFMKVDSNIIKGNHDTTSELFSFNHFLKKFNEKAFKENYGGACPILGANPNQLRYWANSKNLSVMPELLLTELGIDEFPIKYWAGSSYSLGRGNAYKVTQNKNTFKSFKNLMAGCEDLCIGTVVKKL